jgi:hypothetical protein
VSPDGDAEPADVGYAVSRLRLLAARGAGEERAFARVAWLL